VYTLPPHTNTPGRASLGVQAWMGAMVWLGNRSSVDASAPLFATGESVVILWLVTPGRKELSSLGLIPPSPLAGVLAIISLILMSRGSNHELAMHFLVHSPQRSPVQTAYDVCKGHHNRAIHPIDVHKPVIWCLFSEKGLYEC
jgi:hypothetical protein